MFLPLIQNPPTTVNFAKRSKPFPPTIPAGGIDSFETISLYVYVNPWPTGLAIFMNVEELLISRMQM